MNINFDLVFPKGLLRPELFVGVASSIAARTVGINLSEAGRASGSHFAGNRYGRGEVGEFVLIEGQQSLLLGRITDVRLREQERRSVGRDFAGSADLTALGQIQLLGCVSPADLKVTAGVDAYPRLGDRIYAAPHRFIGLLPRLMDEASPIDDDSPSMHLDIGEIGQSDESIVSVTPERLFGRHCAILGATGGGKSWTVARLVEECGNHASKVILIDPTGEYAGFTGTNVSHSHLGGPVESAPSSLDCALPPTSFTESDFIALFEPAGRVQGPKLRAAIRSLRLAKLRCELAPEGFIRKIDQPKGEIEAAAKTPEVAGMLDDPRQPFEVGMLPAQIEQECVYPDGFGKGRGEKDSTKWGGEDGNFSHCLSLVARIEGVVHSTSFEPVFGGRKLPALTDRLGEFGSGTGTLFRIDLSGIGYEFGAREVIVNVIGRYLLEAARRGSFQESPTLLILDEAHSFLGRRLGTDEYATKLDSFELIAKEGRKYGLTLCLATQRPRDLTEDVISQMGTLVVHRLTNDRDREMVERASGEIDRSASAFLPNLRPGEAAIIGVDFPIPVTVRIRKPTVRPRSRGPEYATYWKAPDGSPE